MRTCVGFSAGQAARSAAAATDYLALLCSAMAEEQPAPWPARSHLSRWAAAAGLHSRLPAAPVPS